MDDMAQKAIADLQKELHELRARYDREIAASRMELLQAKNDLSRDLEIAKYGFEKNLQKLNHDMANNQ